MRIAARPICGAPCPHGGASAARKFSRSELGWMGHCNRRVQNFGDRCFQHAAEQGEAVEHG